MSTHAQRSTRTVGRREVLRTGVLAGVAAALWPAARAAAGDPATAEHRGWRNRSAYLTLDVACLGQTFAPDFTGAVNAAAGDLRGTTFNVEGLVYPAGTIPEGEGFDPASVPATGLWLCAGWFILHPDRPLPHVATTQHYLLGPVTGQDPSPADQLVSSGLEGGVPEVVRPVVGGIGRHRKAGGQVVQTVTGTNTTTLRIVGEPAPNFRFAFTQ